MAENDKILEELTGSDYKYGFVSEIEQDIIPKGLNEDVVRFISEKKNEPEWLLEWRLKAYRHWLTMEEPIWENVSYPKIQISGLSLLRCSKTETEVDEYG